MRGSGTPSVTDALPMMSPKTRSKVAVLIVVRWPVGGIRSYLRYTYGLLSPNELELSIVGPESAELDECRRALSAFQPKLRATRSSSITDIAAGVISVLQSTPIDVVHSQGYSSALAAAVPVRLKRLPHLVTIHDMFTDALRKTWKVRLGRLGLAAALGVVDVIQPTGAAVEANLRSHMNLWPATRPRVRTLPNGVDVARFAGNERRDLRAELQLKPNDFLVGFLGRFMAIKGFHCLISAMELLRREGNLPAKPVVIAVGSGGFSREDRAFIERKGLGDHFRFLPHTNDVAATLRGLDVLVIPSFSEASPILPMEALCSGVHVVASDCPGLVEVLRESPAQLFPVGDSAQLARALRQTIQSGSPAVESFRSEAMKRFDSSRTALALRCLVLGLASGRDPLRRADA